MNINRDNYEGFFLLLLDRELGPAEKQEVEKFLVENEDLRKEFALLQETIMTPADIVFEGKDLLLRKEEKRRMIPLFWLRIAASVALIITGSWIIFTVVNKRSSENTVAKEFAKTRNSKIKSGSAVKPVSENNDIPPANGLPQNAVQKKTTGGKEFIKAKNQKNGGAQEKKDNPSSVSNDGLNTNDDLTMQDEAVIALHKPVTPDLQSRGTRAGVDPEQPGVVASGINPSAPVLTAIPVSQNIKNENPEPDYQTDNAISVVALNERNKSITGFFKKIIRRPPVNENDRKLRVSVFQISY